MPDQSITCSECRDVFVFSAAEQSFYAEKGLAAPPKRCKACRQARKAARGPASGPPPARRFSNDVNEYRSPMSGGAPEPWGARRAGAGGGGDRGRRDGGARGPRDNFRPRSPANGNSAAAPAPWSNGGGARSEYRSPAFREAPRPDAGRGGSEPPRRPRASGGAPSAGGPPREAPPQPRARAERPRFDITCASCGVAAQVPFKPLEGREVFCQDCYRARRGVGKDVPAADEAQDADAGIVE